MLFATQTSPYIRYAATLGVLVFIILLWSLLLFNRLNSVIDRYHSASVLYEETIQAEQKTRIKEIELQKNIVQLKEQINTLIGSVDQVDLFQSGIASLLSDSVSLQLYTPGKDKDKQWYTKHAVQLRFETDYNGLISLMNGIQRNTTMLQCKECLITIATPGTYTCSCTIEQIQNKKSLKSKALQLGKAEGLGG